jgi:hypothetical protein
MAAKCPINEINGDVTFSFKNQPEFRLLAQRFGFDVAYSIIESNNDKIPSPEELGYKVIKNKFNTNKDEVVNTLKRINNLFSNEKVVDENGEERYKLINGHIVKNRVTDIVDREYKLKYGNKRNKYTEVLSEIGTVGHAQLEEIIKHLVNNNGKLDGVRKTDKRISDSSFYTLKELALYIYKDIMLTQSMINKRGKPEIFTELKIYDEKKDLAGTIDLLVVFSDGSYSIYDWKFMNNKEKSSNLDDIAPYIKSAISYKLISTKKQLSIYRNIVEKISGLKLPRKQTFIPIFFDAQISEEDFVVNDLLTITNGFSSDGRSLINPIPIEKYTGSYEDVSGRISDLYRIRDKMINNIANNKNKSKSKKKLDDINQLISLIENGATVNNIVHELNDIYRIILGSVDETDPTSPKYLSIKDLRDFETVIDTISLIIEANKRFSKIKSKEIGVTIDSLDQIYKDIHTVIEVTRSMIRSRKNEIVENIAKQVDEDFNAPMFEIGKLSAYISGRIDFDHPLLKTINKYIDVTAKKRDDFVLKVVEKLKEPTEKLIKYQRGRGLKGDAVYDFMIDKEKGSIINKYDRTLFEKINKLREEGRVDELKEFYSYDEEVKNNIQKGRENYKKYLENRGYLEEDINKMLDKWDEKNNYIKYTEALLNPNNKFLRLKDLPNYYSAQYRNIINNPVYKEFYDTYHSILYEINKILPYDKRLRSNFMFKVRSDISDLVANNDFLNPKALASVFKDFFMVDENYINIQDNNEEVPFLFTSELEDGSITYDLSKSLVLGAYSAAHYAMFLQVEDSILALKEHINQINTIKTSAFGVPLRTKTGEYDTSGSPKTVKTVFDEIIQKEVYMKSFTHKDKVVEVGEGNYVSAVKTIRTLMNYTTMTLLSLSPLAIFATFIGPVLNAWMKSKVGTLYNAEVFNSTVKQLINPKNNKSLIRNYEMFRIDDAESPFHKAKEVYSSWKKRVVDMDFFMGLFRLSERPTNIIVTNSILKSYTIEKETGRIIPLRKAESGSKSIYELLEEKDFEDVINDDQFVELRAIIYTAIKNISGKISSQTNMAINNYILFKVFSMFKTWTFGLFEERLRNPKYNAITQEVQLGRYRVAIGEIFRDGILKSSTELIKLITEVSTFGLYKRSVNEEAARIYYEKFLSDNNLTEAEVSFEEYMQSRVGQMRALALELRMYLITLLMFMMLGGDVDDDGEPNFAEIPGGALLYRMVKKSAVELGFMFNPSELGSLFNSLTPMIGTLRNLGGIVTNGIDELFGLGDEKRDRTPLLHFTAKSTPVARQILSFYDIVINNNASTTSLVKVFEDEED